MKLQEYQHWLGQLDYGKRLPSALYLFRNDESDFGSAINQLLARIMAAFQIGSEFNVVKFRTDDLKVSFLAYPGFFDEAHPVLSKAVTVDLQTGKVRHTHYQTSSNPPILHRKEMFLPQDHPRRGEFEALTRQEEVAGLYEQTATIGFKLNWERLLDQKGIGIEGHHLHRRETVVEHEPQPQAEPRPLIERHKTALTRYELSKPVKSLLEYGLVKSGSTFFDYGCGQGSDVRGLQALGHSAAGWDPVHQPDVAKQEADIVNLGYVLNVIEDPAERVEALVDAHRHAKRLLVVSGLIRETVETDRALAYRDGIVTRRNTFQTFFEQQELQQ